MQIFFKESEESLKKTLRTITPKNKKLRLDIKGKTSIKDRLNKMKSKIGPKNKKKSNDEYIEYKD